MLPHVGLKPFSNLIDKTKKKKRVLLFYFDTKYIRIQTFAKGMKQSTDGEELIIKVSLIVYRAKIRTVLEDFFLYCSIQQFPIKKKEKNM